MVGGASEVVRISRQGRDYVLLLNSGEQVPIARSRLTDLRQQGWFDIKPS